MTAARGPSPWPTCVEQPRQGHPPWTIHVNIPTRLTWPESARPILGHCPTDRSREGRGGGRGVRNVSIAPGCVARNGRGPPPPFPPPSACAPKEGEGAGVRGAERAR